MNVATTVARLFYDTAPSVAQTASAAVALITRLARKRVNCVLYSRSRLSCINRRLEAGGRRVDGLLCTLHVGAQIMVSRHG